MRLVMEGGEWRRKPLVSMKEWTCWPVTRSLRFAHVCSRAMHVGRSFAGCGYRRLNREEEEEKLVDREGFLSRTLEKIVLLVI